MMVCTLVVALQVSCTSADDPILPPSCVVVVLDGYHTDTKTKFTCPGTNDDPTTQPNGLIAQFVFSNNS